MVACSALCRHDLTLDATPSDLAFCSYFCSFSHFRASAGLTQSNTSWDSWRLAVSDLLDHPVLGHTSERNPYGTLPKRPSDFSTHRSCQYLTCHIMSRSGFPPTPAPSTDITGKDNAGSPHIDPSFKLPPSAYAHKISPLAEDASHNHQHHTPPTYILPSPTSPPNGLESHRMSNNSQMAAYTGDISLPPPPTRTRKIIQMKPGAPPKKGEPESEATSSQGKNGAGSGAPGKKKQSAGTSAGRKIARKTAHSLIERRRRSKMNEEFGVLKDMIPACNGQEMHKLAILQVSFRAHVQDSLSYQLMKARPV